MAKKIYDLLKNKLECSGLSLNSNLWEEMQTQSKVMTLKKNEVLTKLPFMINRVSSKNMVHFLGVSQEW